jgi:hypothetical protein
MGLIGLVEELPVMLTGVIGTIPLEGVKLIVLITGLTPVGV